jgi:hypothetical protein
VTRNHLGKTLYVAQAVPATNDDTGFEALTWVQVKGPQVLPQLGVSHADIEVPDVATGFTQVIKGAASGVESTMSFRNVDSDDGQEDIMEQAVNAQGLVSIKIVTGSGTDSGDGPAPTAGDPVQYAQGVVKNYQEIQGDTTTHEGFSVTFRQNDFTVNAVEPTP